MGLKKIRIFVTPRDVREGRAGACLGCPLARALSRRCRQPMWVGIGTFAPEGIAVGQALTEGMFSFRKKFDGRTALGGDRFNFTVQVPEEWIK